MEWDHGPDEHTVRAGLEQPSQMVVQVDLTDRARRGSRHADSVVAIEELGHLAPQPPVLLDHVGGRPVMALAAVGLVLADTVFTAVPVLRVILGGFT